MAEEIQTQKNTVATVGMRFSIVGLILLITVFFSRLWLPLLFVWLILWIVGLFSKPRGRARVAIIIPLLVYIAWIIAWIYVWNSIKTPLMNFSNNIQTTMDTLEKDENFDEERFSKILEAELNGLKTYPDTEIKDIIDASTWSNILEKFFTTVFGLVQQGFDNAVEKYENWEIPEINDDDGENVFEITIETSEKSNEQQVTNNQEQNNSEVFTASEQNDIEHFLNILE